MVYIKLRKYGRQVSLSAGYKPTIHIPLSQDHGKKKKVFHISPLMMWYLNSDACVQLYYKRGHQSYHLVGMLAMHIHASD